MSTVHVHPGDCLDVLRTLPDSSVHAVITDPPYGLSNTDPAHVVETLTRWASGERDYVPTGKGFMGKSWDAFVPPPAVWDECLRVLKPGGHLLAFAGSRTFDLMTLSIRFAGFDIRDGIAWLYGSGFPKSLDVSKAIDQAGGLSPVEQARALRATRERAGMSQEDVAQAVGCSLRAVQIWEEGRARSGNVEHIIPSPRYRTALADLLGYTADERAVVGTRTDRRGDDTVVGLGHSGTEYGGPATAGARTWQGWGTALKPAFEPVVVARKPLAGTVAQTVLAHGTGALNIDATKTDAGRWPTNVVLDGHAADALDEQSGYMRDGTAVNRNRGGVRKPSDVGYTSSKVDSTDVTYGGGGGASRFFPTFRYQAKAPTRERPSYEREDGTRVAHPTVKPVELMRWLVRLVTPPGGTVLDPFAGSGATVEAALLEGFDVIAVEREPEYLPLIAQRIARAAPAPEDTDQ